MNPKQLMKQVQQMQEQMQQRMTALRVEGSAGGGMVKAAMNGSKELLAITIDKEAVDPNDVEMLQDLVVAAVNEASRKVDEEMSSTVGAMTGGMKIPGLVLRWLWRPRPAVLHHATARNRVTSNRDITAPQPIINELQASRVGGSASRIALHILKRTTGEAESLANAIARRRRFSAVRRATT
jgi:DNA-binding YbaB/EbfC family protein